MSQLPDKFLARLRTPAPSKYVHRYRREAIVAAVGMLVLAGCMLLVRNGDVGDAERSVFAFVNGWPDALKAPMWVFQIIGSLAFVVAAAVTALAIRRYRLGVALAAAIPLKLVFEWWVVKALVERERPFFTIPDAAIRDVNTSALGFPSGHAVLAFALAGLVAPYLGRRGRLVLYALAIMNSVARVYLGAHNPLDVVAGAALGVSIAAGLNAVVGTPVDDRSHDSAAPVE